MPARVSCPGCGSVLTLPEEALDKGVRCEKCQQVFRPALPTGGGQTLPPRAGPVPPSRRPSEVTARPQTAAAGSGVSPVVWILGGLAALLFVVCLGLAGLGLAAWSFLASRSSAPVADNGRLFREPGAPAAIDEEKHAADPIPHRPGPGDGPLRPPGAGFRDDRVIRLDAPVVVPPAAAAVIKPPELRQEKVVRPLPAPVADVAVGGGGRYLVLHLPGPRQLAVFDANEGRVVKYLALGAGDVKIAAGMNAFVVVLGDDRVVQRWSLTTFEREASAPLPVRGRVNAVALGSASTGPLLVQAGEWPDAAEVLFFDLREMRKIDLAFPRQGGYFATGPGVFVRASADGRVFASHLPGHTGVQTCVFSDRDLRKYEHQEPGFPGGFAGGSPVPGPDGRVVYTSVGPFTEQLRPIPGNQAWCLPAHHGPYYLSVQTGEPLGVPRPPAPGGDPGTTRVVVHLGDDPRPFAQLAQLEGAEPGEPAPGLMPGGPRGPGAPGARPGLSLDQRLHFLPDAKLIVVLPPEADRLILHRFDPEQALARAEFDYLVVTSRASRSVRRGEEYRYALAVRSKQGGVQYRLESGPRGMTIGADGRLSWMVPADFADAEVDVIIAVKDRVGQEVFHTFKVSVLGKDG